MAERFMTRKDMAAEYHISDMTVKYRLDQAGVKPFGKRFGVAVYCVDPEELLVPRSEKLRKAGWRVTSEILEIIGKSKWIISFLESVGAKRDGKPRQPTFWLLPEELRDKEALWRAYHEWARRREAAHTAWKARIDKNDGSEEEDGDWLMTVPNGPIKDMVLKEREDRKLIGTEIEVETPGGRRVRGTLLGCSMNSVTMQVGRSTRFWLRREVTIIN